MVSVTAFSVHYRACDLSSKMLCAAVSVIAAEVSRKTERALRQGCCRLFE